MSGQVTGESTMAKVKVSVHKAFRLETRAENYTMGARRSKSTILGRGQTLCHVLSTPGQIHCRSKMDLNLSYDPNDRFSDLKFNSSEDDTLSQVHCIGLC